MPFRISSTPNIDIVTAYMPGAISTLRSQNAPRPDCEDSNLMVKAVSIYLEGLPPHYIAGFSWLDAKGSSFEMFTGTRAFEAMKTSRPDLDLDRSTSEYRIGGIWFNKMIYFQDFFDNFGININMTYAQSLEPQAQEHEIVHRLKINLRSFTHPIHPASYYDPSSPLIFDWTNATGECEGMYILMGMTGVFPRDKEMVKEHYKELLSGKIQPSMS